MLGVILDQHSLHPADLDFSALRNSLQDWQFYPRTALDQRLSRCLEAEVIVTNKVLLDAPLLEQLPKLKLICIAATGTNNVDLDCCRRLNIRVCNARAYGTDSVVQQTLAMLLSLACRLPQYQTAVAQGRWQQSPDFCLLDYPSWEIQGKTLGIVGYGELGQAVAKAAQALGMKILVAEGSSPGQPGRLPLSELLPQIDVLSLHCPLTEHTRHLIGSRQLQQMKAGSLLLNLARGGIVDEQALADALLSGHLGGAGVDVLSQEPPDGRNPLLNPDLPNLILTPHTAWAGLKARQTLLNQITDNILAFLANQPQRVVV